MTKQFCDICEKEMFGLKFVKDSKKYQFSIASNGRLLDICDECREDLATWIKNRKVVSDEVN